MGTTCNMNVSDMECIVCFGGKVRRKERSNTESLRNEPLGSIKCCKILKR
jgi:hypothetical protein